MSDNMNAQVLLVGAGGMAVDYAKVLKGLNRTFIVVGRGEESARKFEEKTGVDVRRGGLEKFLASSDRLPSNAIVAVGVPQLASTCAALLKSGVKNILLEKPGAASIADFQSLHQLALANRASVSIAYNRRFYASTRAAKRCIEEDGGVTSFNFEFTEWLHVFENLGRDMSKFMPRLFIGNSTHVVDVAFHLGGEPTEIACYKKQSSTYDCNAIFAGAGISDRGALFCYQANWEAPGRWSVEVLTRKRRLIFRPLEKLQIQQMRTVRVEFADDVDYSLDTDYKPGLYLETEAFLDRNENFGDLCSLEEQCARLPIYQKISDGIA